MNYSDKLSLFLVGEGSSDDGIHPGTVAGISIAVIVIVRIATSIFSGFILLFGALVFGKSKEHEELLKSHLLVHYAGFIVRYCRRRSGSVM